MNNLYQRIQDNISCLPLKDKQLCEQFIQQRDFERAYSLVSSALYMKEQDDRKEVHKEKWVNVDLASLQALNADILEYMSYLDISDVTNEEYY